MHIIRVRLNVILPNTTRKRKIKVNLDVVDDSGNIVPTLHNRSRNGEIEKLRLISLVDKLNNGDELTDEINLLIDKPISKFKVAGGCSNSYDIVGTTEDGDEILIEVKCLTNKIDLGIPWGSTQLVNDTWSSFEISKVYYEYWYNEIIPRHIIQQYPSLPERPSNIEYKKDMDFGSVKSEFGKALKTMRKSDENTYNKCFDDWHRLALEHAFEVLKDSNKKQIFEQQIAGRMNTKLRSKHLFINCSFPNASSVSTQSADGFVAKVSNVSQISNLKSGIVYNNKGQPNIKTTYNFLNDPSQTLHTGEARLRWGNGNGIANLRWNIK